ncbi:MAG: hypothetical protein KBH01_04695 [Breznakibacter sp.]|nr:hypothetical protein [Breznakibacter sp.]
MSIEEYKTLISNLPVRQQCFTTKRTTWISAENEIDWLKNLNDKLFGDQATLSISRQDIFETKEPREKIIKTIYWGYNAGMRGNHFVNILKYIIDVEKVLLKLKQNANPTTIEYFELTEFFNEITGLGLSTYSKLLYFFQIEFNSNPCLILDQRLIDVFAGETYYEFQQLSNIRYSNAEKKYLDYLKLTRQLASQIETKGENIEQFLFVFGNNLKI